MTDQPDHSELLPCPFCGDENVRASEQIVPNTDIRFTLAVCANCAAAAPPENWNTRAPHLAAENDRLQAETKAAQDVNLANHNIIGDLRKEADRLRALLGEAREGLQELADASWHSTSGSLGLLYSAGFAAAGTHASDHARSLFAKLDETAGG